MIQCHTNDFPLFAFSIMILPNGSFEARRAGEPSLSKSWFGNFSPLLKIQVNVLA